MAYHWEHSSGTNFYSILMGANEKPLGKFNWYFFPFMNNESPTNEKPKVILFLIHFNTSCICMPKEISSKYTYKQKIGIRECRAIAYFVKLYFKSNSPFTILLFYYFYIKSWSTFFQFLLPLKGGLVFSFNFFYNFSNLISIYFVYYQICNVLGIPLPWYGNNVGHIVTLNPPCNPKLKLGPIEVVDSVIG